MTDVKQEAVKVTYVRVAENEQDEPIELPLESDGTLLLSTVNAQFTNVSGLKYRASDTKNLRGIRLGSNGQLYPPENGGWNDQVFYCVFPKDKKRRLSDDESDSCESRRCTDLIILNIPYNTTEEQLKEYLEAQGEVIMVQLKKDLASGKSKGFGFVRYKNYSDQLKMLSKRHMIDGRWCDIRIPSHATAMHSANGYGVGGGGGGGASSAGEAMPFKLFVGRVTEALRNDDIQAYFEKYGQITEVYRPQPFRGFVFVNFVSSDAVRKICEEDHQIKGVSVYVSNASPKSSKRQRLSSNDGRGMNSGSNSGYVFNNFDNPYASTSSSSSSSGIRSWQAGNPFFDPTLSGRGNDYRSPYGSDRSQNHLISLSDANYNFTRRPH